MPSIIVLDTGPLSNSVVAPVRRGKIPTVSEECRDWISACEQAGALLLVPAIAYYEALREIERRDASRQRENLREFVFALPDRFLPLTTFHLEMAARMWSAARRGGYPTASDDALDGDVILAAQALGLGLSSTDYIVATTNVGHLTRYVPCDEWANIRP